MKRIVLVFGLIAGGVMSAMLLLTLPFHDAIGFDRGVVIGYASMVAAFLLIFFGVRSYRDGPAGGSVGFGRAFAVGTLIALVASLCYVATWEVVFFTAMPDYLTKYQAYEIEQARAEGASEAAIAQKRVEQEKFAKQFDNIAFNAAVSLAEPLPVGLVIALVSAGVLSRRRKKEEPVVGPRDQ